MKYGQHWFVGADIARALNYANGTQAIHDHCKYATKVDLSKRYGHEMATSQGIRNASERLCSYKIKSFENNKIVI